MADVAITITNVDAGACSAEYGVTHTQYTPDSGVSEADSGAKDTANAILNDYQYHNQHIISFGGTSLERTGGVDASPWGVTKTFHDAVTTSGSGAGVSYANGAASTLTDTGKSWTVNAYAGQMITSGDSIAYCVSNTATVMTLVNLNTNVGWVNKTTGATLLPAAADAYTSSTDTSYARPAKTSFSGAATTGYDFTFDPVLGGPNIATGADPVGVPWVASAYAPAYNGSTTLTGAHTAAVTTLTVGSTAAFNSTGRGTIHNSSGNAEDFEWTGKTATTLTGVTRGVVGTTARAWVGGETVIDNIYVMYSVRVAPTSTTATYCGLVLSNTTTTITLVNSTSGENKNEAFWDAIRMRYNNDPGNTSTVELYKHIFRFDVSAIERRMVYIRDTLGQQAVCTIYGWQQYATSDDQQVTFADTRNLYPYNDEAGPNSVWLSAIEAMAYAVAKRYGPGGAQDCNLTRFIVGQEYKGHYRLAGCDGATQPNYYSLYSTSNNETITAATAGWTIAATTITGPGASFTANEHAGTSVFCNGSLARVVSNTTTVLTLDRPRGAANAWHNLTSTNAPDFANFDLKIGTGLNGTSSFYGAMTMNAQYTRVYRALKQVNSNNVVSGPYPVIHDANQRDAWVWWLVHAVTADAMVFDSTAGKATGGAPAARSDFTSTATSTTSTTMVKTGATFSADGVVAGDLVFSGGQTLTATSVGTDTITGTGGWIPNHAQAASGNGPGAVAYYITHVGNAAGTAGVRDTISNASSWFATTADEMGDTITDDLVAYRDGNTHQSSSLSSIPKWMAEWYFDAELGGTALGNSHPYAVTEAYQAAVMTSGAMGIIRCGFAMMLRWQPMGIATNGFQGNNQSLVRDVRAASTANGGGTATAFADTFTKMSQRFGLSRLKTVTISVASIDCISNGSWTLLANKRGVSRTYSINGGPDGTLTAYEIKWIANSDVPGLGGGSSGRDRRRRR